MVNKNSLWERLVAAKYHFENWDNVRTRRGASPLGRAICGSAKWVQFGFKWHIGDSTNINILSDPWLDEIPLNRSAVPMNSAAHDDWKVAQLLTNTDMWNVEVLSSLFSDDLVQKILSIPLSKNQCNDHLVWKHHCGPTIRVKEIYNQILLCQHNDIQLRLDWIWKLPIAPQVKVFYWKLCWGYLPCKMFFASRNILHDQEPTCDLYMVTNENLDHCFFSWPRIQPIWIILNQTHLAPHHANSLVDIIDLLASVMISSQQKSMICYTLWSI